MIKVDKRELAIRLIEDFNEGIECNHKLLIGPEKQMDKLINENIICPSSFQEYDVTVKLTQCVLIVISKNGLKNSCFEIDTTKDKEQQIESVENYLSKFISSRVPNNKTDNIILLEKIRIPRNQMEDYARFE